MRKIVSASRMGPKPQMSCIGHYLESPSTRMGYKRGVKNHRPQNDVLFFYLSKNITFYGKEMHNFIYF